jgi:hypothetical protein
MSKPRISQSPEVGKIVDLATVRERVATKGPPHDREAEEMVAGTLLFFGHEVAEKVFAEVSPDHFYLDRPRHVFLAGLKLFSQGEPINLASIRDVLASEGQLGEGFLTWATGLERALIGPSFLDQYLKSLKKAKQARDLWRVLLEAIQNYDERDPALLRDDLARRLEELGQDARRRLPQAEDAATFLARQLPEQMFLIEPSLLPRGGKAFIGGAPKMGKSLLALHMSVALAAGKPILTLFETRQSRVLYINLEVAEAPFQERLEQVAGTFSLSAEERKQALRQLFVVSPGPIAINQQAGFLWLRGQIQRCLPDVVILDPLVKAHTLDENSGADMRVLLNSLDLLSREFGVSWLVVHHYHKPSALAGHRTGGQQLRGSSVLFGDVDAVFGLSPEEKPTADGPPATILEITSRYGLPLNPIPLRLEQTLAWSLIARRGRPRKKGPGAVVEALRENGSLNYEALVAAVMKQADVSERTAKRYIAEAVKKELALCSSGIYHLAEPF